MTAIWLWLYPPLILVLVAGAVFVHLTDLLKELFVNGRDRYIHINSTELSLPISPHVTIFTIILPLLAAANTVFYLRSRTISNQPRRVTLAVFQVAQVVLTPILGTRLFFSLVPSEARDCLLSTIWQRLFSHHDAESIRRIQDALNCCGFNTVRDRAWPFPNHETSRRCTEAYGREIACAQPWRDALQRNAGVGFGIVLAVAVLRILGWVLEASLASTNKTRYGTMNSYGTNDEPERSLLLPGAVGAAADGRDVSHVSDQAEQGSTTENGSDGHRPDITPENPW